MFPARVKDLWTLLDCKLCFHRHFHCIVYRGSEMLSLIQYIASSFCTADSLLFYYTTSVRSKLEYTSLIHKGIMGDPSVIRPVQMFSTTKWSLTFLHLGFLLRIPNIPYSILSTPPPPTFRQRCSPMPSFRISEWVEEDKILDLPVHLTSVPCIFFLRLCK
jgi:hypothetical protein